MKEGYNMSNINLEEDYLYQKGYRKIVKCPVCGEDTLDFYFVCPNCGWEHDSELNEGYSPANNIKIEDYKSV